MSRDVLMFLAGRILLALGGLQLVPLLFSLLGPTEETWAFGTSALSIMAAGLVFCWRGRRHKDHMDVREAAALLLIVWLLLALTGMLPYLFIQQMTWVDAIFESVSGVTTTGATCISGEVPQSILLWQGMTQWMGGLSILILLVTVLPQVSGCFGLSLLVRQNSPASQRLAVMWQGTLRVVKAYALVTALIVGLCWLCGLDVFQAVRLALVTLSTGGGCDITLRANGLLQLVAALCMLFASSNFLFYWGTGQHTRLRDIKKDSEFRIYLEIVLFFGLLVSWHLWRMGVYAFDDSLRMGFFHVISFASTTGLAAGDFGAWPDFDRYALFILAFAGGCIGSATGGIRMMRLLVLFKTAAAEMRRTLHPHMVVSIRAGHRPVPARVIGRILNFFFLYIMVYFLFVLLISLSGLSVLESMGLAAACLSSVGSVSMLADTAVSFACQPDWVKLLCSFLMILGRLEIFSFLLVLQTGFRDLQHKW